MTTSGTEEAILFAEGENSPVEHAQAVLKPYNDLPVSLEFSCPARLATFSPSYVVPLPPVIPAGFASKKPAALRVTMPESMDEAFAQSRIVTQAGTAMRLSEAKKSSHPSGSTGTVETIFTLDKECEALNGAQLELAAVSYNNRSYPPSRAQLQFDSRITAGIGWWPPALFNGGHAIGKATDAH